jgi:hypothetical protein
VTKRIDKVNGYLVTTYERTAADRAAALNPQDLSDATWFAVFEEFYSPYNATDDIMGRGATEAAAIADLFELPWAKWWQENPPRSDADLDKRLSAMRPFPRNWLNLGKITE